MKNFRYILPKNLDEVLMLLQEFKGKNTYPMAGGTDILVGLKNEEISPKCLIDLKGIPSLNFVGYDENVGLKIGALSSIAEIGRNLHIRDQYAALYEAALGIGSVQIRNRGTIGGNLCNASPAADLAPPLLVLNAQIRILGKKGERDVHLENFFLGPGKTVLQENEILKEIYVPKLPPRSGTTYLKFSRRGGMDLPIVGVACLLAINRECFCEQARLAMGAVGPTPLRAKKAETVMAGKRITDDLIEEVGRIAAEEARPISDIRGQANFRREIIRVLVRRAIRICTSRVALRAS